MSTEPTPKLAILASHTTEGKPSDETPPGAPASGNWISTMIALVFWIVILGVGGFWYLQTAKADILLDVAFVEPDLPTEATAVSATVEPERAEQGADDPPKAGQAETAPKTKASAGPETTKPTPRRAGFLGVSGQVLVDGKPAANGSVHIVVHDGAKKYLVSKVLPVQSSGGLFGEPKLLEASASQELRVAATYSGALIEEGKSLEAVSGSTIRFVNVPTPLEPKQVMWITGSMLTLLLLLIFLFTGELTRGKARALFAVTYFTTFLSLALPLAGAMLISQNDYLIQIMEKAAVGLVKGHTPNVPDDEWLVNIGGMAGAPAAGTDPSALTRVYPSGLAVPFYIVMLAMLGAGINMTRQVPKVQAAYDEKIVPRRESMFLAVLHAPGSMFRSNTVVTDPNEREAAAIIRKQLIDSYMYLLAAPFIAIAVFYLLQVVATNTAKPVLVLMAFSTGLISDTIVSTITDFAQKTIGTTPSGETKTGADAPAEPRAADDQSPPTAAEAAAAAAAAPTGEAKPDAAPGPAQPATALPDVPASTSTAGTAVEAGAPAARAAAGATDIAAVSSVAIDPAKIETAVKAIIGKIEAGAGGVEPAATAPAESGNTGPKPDH